MLVLLELVFIDGVEASSFAVDVEVCMLKAVCG